MREFQQTDERQPFNEAEARKLSREHQRLVGQVTLNDKGQQGEVVAVTVAPFDTINKWIFLHFYQEHGDVRKAIEFYKPPFYDVVLIMKLSGSGKLYYTELHKHLHTAANDEPAMKVG